MEEEWMSGYIFLTSNMLIYAHHPCLLIDPTSH